MKITVGNLKKLIKESLGAKMDEDLLYSLGWYPLDDRLMVWAHNELTDGEPVKRGEALKIARPNRKPDPFPGIG